ncbi:MAG: cytochrome c biogenesis CcdA family protein [bacterium]
MSNNISLLVAFWGGIISFFSPCILPLIPLYISYISGVSSYSSEIRRSRSFLITRVLVFVLGFSLIFTILGASASFIGNWIMNYSGIFLRIGGIILIIFGVSFLGILKIPFLFREFKINIKGIGGFFESFLLGMTFALGWTPCVTPILSSILILAATQTSIYKGMMMLFVYALGLGIPFIVVAIFWERYIANASKIRRIIPYISFIGGVFIIVVGIFMVLGRMFTQIFF